MGKYIKTFNSRDKDAFTGFKNCGHLSHRNLKQLGISETKIKNYCREGLVKKVSYDIKGQRDNGICYKLTAEGRAVAENKFELKNFMQSVDGHERHNLDVANKYLSLSKEERANTINEREVRELVQEKIYEIENKQERDQYQEMLEQGIMSMPDIIYTRETGVTVTVAYETITNNYGIEEIQAKIETCTFLNIELEQHKI